MSTGEIISIAFGAISVGFSIYFAAGKHKAKNEVKQLKRFLDYKKLEEFAVEYRKALKDYSRRVLRPKWNETIQGKDIIGGINDVLTRFNTHLPKMDSFLKQQLTEAIDEAKKDFSKVRKGDDYYRDISLQHLEKIDRLLNEEKTRQSQDFLDLL